MIAIIDYNSSNIRSVTNALKRLGCDFVVTNDPQVILKADKVILPGVGRAGQAMRELKDLGLVTVIPKVTVPFLGICLGMQLLLTDSLEDDIPCLGVIPGTVRKLPDTVRVPQTGWNRVVCGENALCRGIRKENSFYFVHSYYCDVLPEYTLGTATYGIEFPVMIQNKNFYGIQFHPEKSSTDGEQLLRNFLAL